jgi:PAS domain S-box-containing protein
MDPSKCLPRLAGSAPENHQEKSLESDEALFRNAAGEELDNAAEPGAEEALYQDQVKYRILVEESPLGIAIVGPQGENQYLNPRFEEVFGYTVADIPTMEAAMARFYPDPHYRQEVVSALLQDTKELRPGKAMSRIFTVVCKNGTEKIVNFRLVALANRSRMVLCEDVTECHQARQALVESERRFRQLVEHAADAVFLHDKGKIIMVNQQACTSLGYAREELQKMTIADIEAALGPQELQKSWKKQSKSPITIRGVHRRKDGSTFPVEVRAGDIIYDGQHLRLALVRDITDRLKIEEALGQSEIKYRNLAEAAPSGISIIGKDGRYKYLNPKFINMFGYNLDDIPTGREWFPKAFPDSSYRDMVISDWKKEFKKAQVGEVKARTFRVTCKDGTVKVIDFRPVALVTGDWMMFYEDITKRVRAEEALRQSEQKLHALAAQLLTAQEDERKRLAAELHDELGHALLTLKLSIGSLEKQLTPEQISVTQEFKKMGRFIGETIKKVRRLYLDLTPGDLEDLGLTEALRDMIEEVAAPQKQIKWEVVLDNLDDSFPLPVQTAIYRVVQEALTNIGKHAKAKNVAIVAQRGSRGISVTIEDDGRGFEAAKGLDTKRSLGLLTMEERVKILGGTFILQSQKKHGTRISFSVPFLEGN